MVAIDPSAGRMEGRAFAVVGAGVVGLSLARALRRRGAEVTVVEARRAGEGSSGAAAGILPQPRPGRSMIRRLERGAHAGYRAFLREVERESGSTIESAPLGYADLAFTEEEEADLRSLLARSSDRAAGTGADAERWIGPEEARGLAPVIGPGLRGALFSPLALWVHPPQLVAALRKAAAALGVKILEGMRASLDRRRGGSGWDLRLDPAGELRRMEVVIASGAWTGELLESGGMNPGAKGEPPRIVPVRGQMVEAACTEPLRTILNHRDAYLIPRPGGRVWLGATVEEAGFDERVTEEGIAWLLGRGRAILPGLGAVVRSWYGLRPKLLRRGGPLIGEGDPPVLAGHYRSGIHLGPITAEILASRLSGEARSRIAPFEFDPPA